LSPPLSVRSYKGVMQYAITTDTEEVSKMAKKDEGTRDIKKGKESER
jgi:hypothetical protein